MSGSTPAPLAEKRPPRDTPANTFPRVRGFAEWGREEPPVERDSAKHGPRLDGELLPRGVEFEVRAALEDPSPARDPDALHERAATEPLTEANR